MAAPWIAIVIKLSSNSTHAVILKTLVFHALRIVDISAVENDATSHGRSDP
ncbi:hypothetical protein MAHJHV50_49500 [Mycobacterium avium subsp. hominissuis]